MRKNYRSDINEIITEWLNDFEITEEDNKMIGTVLLEKIYLSMANIMILYVWISYLKNLKKAISKIKIYRI